MRGELPDIDTFNNLPLELREQIASEISGYDLLNLCASSRTTSALCLSNLLWKHLVMRDYPDVYVKSNIQSEPIIWFDLYKQATQKQIEIKKHSLQLLQGLKQHELSFDVEWQDAIKLFPKQFVHMNDACGTEHLAGAIVEFEFEYTPEFEDIILEKVIYGVDGKIISEDYTFISEDITLDMLFKLLSSAYLN